MATAYIIWDRKQRRALDHLGVFFTTQNADDQIARLKRKQGNLGNTHNTYERVQVNVD